MGIYLIYDETTYTPRYVQNYPTGESPEGETYIELDSFKDLSCFYFENAELKVREKQPSTFHTWDGTAWIENTFLINSSKAEHIEADRVKLLQESDWTELPSALSRLGHNKIQEWQTYRQALRDITSQSGYPTNITWPTKPL
jgi:hypothetical protein